MNSSNQNKEPTGLDHPLKTMNTISNIVNVTDSKRIENEARIEYIEFEIKKLRLKESHFNEKAAESESRTESTSRLIKSLNKSIEAYEKSLELQEVVIPLAHQGLEYLQKQFNESERKYDEIYNEHVEKYNKMRTFYETNHSLYKKLKELKIEKLKLDVENRIVQQKIIQQKRINAQRSEIDHQIFIVTIVQFVQTVTNYWKARDISHRLKESNRQKQQLTQQLKELEVATEMKRKEMQQTKILMESSDSVKQLNRLPTEEFLSSISNLMSSTSTTLQPTSYASFEERLQQIQAKSVKRQHEQQKHNSFTFGSSLKRPLKSLENYRNIQKRDVFQSDIQDRHSQHKNPKFDIIDVQVVAPGNKERPFKHPQNIHQSIIDQSVPAPQQTITSHHNSGSQQNFNSTSNSILQDNAIVPLPLFKQPQPPAFFQSVKKNQINATENQEKVPTLFEQSPSVFQQHLAFRSEQNKENMINIHANQFKGQPNIPFKQQFSQSKEIKGNTNFGNLQQSMFSQSPFSFKQCITSQSAYNSNNANVKQTTFEENIFVQPQIREIDEKALQYRSQQANSPTQNTYLSSTQSESDVAQTAQCMQLQESQASKETQNKNNEEMMASNQSSTFSQKCHELSQILTKSISENVDDVTSAQTTNPVTNEIVTSPFFNKLKPQEKPMTNIKSSMQMSVGLDENISFDAGAIGSYLDNSAVFDQGDATRNASDDNINALLLSPGYPEQTEVNQDTDNSEPQPQIAGFSFNFAQPQGQAGGNKPLFTSLFNMFS